MSPTKTAPVGRARVNALAGLPPPSLMSAEAIEAEVRAILDANEESARRWACKRPGCNGLPHAGWNHKHARASQRPPDGDWATWLMLTARGWGKTRTAAETVRAWCEESSEPLHIAVIGRKDTLTREINFEHRRSGLLTVLPPRLIKRYTKTLGDLKLELTNGTIIRGFGANEPDNLRGWEFDKGWLDEYAAWNRHTAQETLDMLWFCLREATSPQVVISTTPKPLPHIKKLMNEHREELRKIEAEVEGARETIRLTIGKTSDNQANLSDVALHQLKQSYEGTRLGEQELDGTLLEDVEGALWRSALFEVPGFRIPKIDVPPIERLVIAVDPAVTSTDTADENGFAVVGRSYPFGVEHKDPRPRGYVLSSEAFRATPFMTMKHAAELYHHWKADAVVIEANNGGEYLPALMEQVDPTVNVRIVNATRDKRARATPVAGIYEQSRMSHVGPPRDFDDLETVMTTYVGAKESVEKSPDILDALVWGLWDLFLDPETAAPSKAAQTVDERLKGRR